jgi:PEP-CTERM motif
MKLLCAALPVLLMSHQAAAQALAEPSFATAASPAYERQVLRGQLTIDAYPASPPPPTLAASFAAANPHDRSDTTPVMVSVSPVPEPSGLLLMGTGLAAVFVLWARRARRES